MCSTGAAREQIGCERHPAPPDSVQPAPSRFFTIVTSSRMGILWRPIKGIDGFVLRARSTAPGATTASCASSVLNAIQQGAASAATRDETIEAQHVPTLDSWLVRDESEEIFAVDRDERGKIRWPVDGVVDDYRLATPAVPE